ncbi:phosphate acyltransferase [Acidaminobacter sp. JC074]|uniref:phosphate acyltransferase n=1 Tax=Acidaminobacter sp. JC074 TaxID=2530199 RepID=UPI001F0E113A|nr:phosphate acyltransferase [Acidaminobacter sp. JC074]
MIKTFKDLESLNLSGTKLAVVCPEDKQTLKAVFTAKRNNQVTPILIGDMDKIKSLIDGDSYKTVIIHHTSTPEEASEVAVKMAQKGDVQSIMKGKVDTKVLLKSVVKHIKAGKLMSHFVVHELEGYHKLLAMSDGGMNLYPDYEAKMSILENSVQALHKLGISSPKVAALCAVEKVNPKMPETLDAERLKKEHELDCILEGPISYDLTMSKKSAEIKGFESPVCGDADLLLVPNITVGNILGKSLVYSAGAKMAGVVLGGKVPVILTSRGSSFEEKYYSILLSGQLERGSRD